MLWAVVIHCVLPFYTITSGKGGGHSWVYRSVVGLSRYFTPVFNGASVLQGAQQEHDGSPPEERRAVGLSCL